MTLSSQEPTLTVFPAGIQVVNDPIIAARVTVATLPDPADHLGGIIYTTDGGLRLSDGTQWLPLQTSAGEVVAGEVFQAFRFVIQNVGGTLQHSIRGLNSLVDDPSGLVSGITGASTTPVATPNGPDATTAFANGAKIGGTFDFQIVFDTEPQDSTITAMNQAFMRSNTGDVLDMEISNHSFDVNGVTRNRLTVIFRVASSGADFALNTTNIQNGQLIMFGLSGFMKVPSA